MGRRKGRRYVPLLISIEPEQARKLQGIPNRSALIRGLLDSFFRQEEPLVQEYLQIIEDLKREFSTGEKEVFRLMGKLDDREVTDLLPPSTIAQLKRLKELREQIPKNLLPK